MDDDQRVAVKTYVPSYQKDLWVDHADELDMSQSEFVRTMVQAGRRDFDVPGVGSETHDGGTTDQDDTTGDGDAVANGGVAPRDRFDERIVDVLERDGAKDWEELTNELIDDIEADVDAAIERLQEANRIRYSGRDGGYVLTNHD